MSLFFLANTLKAQTNIPEQEVNYLSSTPVIDGELDGDLTYLKPREFPIKYKSNNDNPDINVTYRLAYGTDFFYVYFEVDAEKLVYRDRAYQNGDGFHMVLAKPRADNEPTEEFYVLAGSAVNKKSMEWTRNIFWYYNVDNIFKRTSKDTKLMFLEKDGKTSFELILPWKDVYPYHPWISENIGFNLCFVKAIGDKEKNIYKVLEDEMGAENSSRKYKNLKFQQPLHETENQTYFVLDRNNIKGKETISGVSATVSNGKDQEELIVKIISGENTLVDYSHQTFTCRQGVNINHFDINKNPIDAGGYKIEWYSKLNSSKGETYLTSLPEFNLSEIRSEIESIKGSISKPSYQTLLFKASEIDKDLNEVKSYETCGNQRLAISKLLYQINKGKNGEDIIANKRGFIRKAYRSELDEKLIPYMVYIPDDYDPNKKYPLLIYLHGSASDETNLKGAKFTIPEGFIALAPNGRGPSNCYTWDNAQTDIAEALNAVTESYSIEETNIILSGFSMGGYGVYRTFSEAPEKYKALAIFSGNPNIANMWSGTNDYMDFTQEKNLEIFKDVPMFIFHGKKDINCAFDITQGIIEKLNKNGAIVKFVTEEDKGHETPGQKTIQSYYEWVQTILNNNE